MKAYKDHAVLLTAMCNGKRLEIIKWLVAEEVSVGALASRVGLSQSALSQHLAKLRSAGLVSVRRDRQVIYYSSSSPAVKAILDALERTGCGGDPTVIHHSVPAT